MELRSSNAPLPTSTLEVLERASPRRCRLPHRSISKRPPCCDGLLRCRRLLRIHLSVRTHTQTRTGTYTGTASVQTKMLNNINAILAMGPDDNKEDAVNSIRKEMNDWTAKYRRNSAMGGKPSFGLMYSAVNALAGHWNNFGADAPVPKKRLVRIVKVCADSLTFRAGLLTHFRSCVTLPGRRSLSCGLGSEACHAWCPSHLLGDGHLGLPH